MTRRRDIPSEAHVRQTLATISAAGRRPTAAGTARELGLSNTTFWRHFRDIALELRAAPEPGSTAAAAVPAPRDHETRLRRERDELAEQLSTALAHLRRLTIDNEQLRHQLEDARKVTNINARPRGRDDLR